MRRMRGMYAGMNASGGAPPWQRGISNFFALPSFIARRRGVGASVEDGNRVRLDPSETMRRRSFSAMPIAPTQEEEDEEWRNLSICKPL